MPFSLRRGIRLSAADWTLLAGASLAQVVTACALRTMSLPALRNAAARLRPLARVILRGSDERIVWAIEATGRRLAGVSTCLVRAIVVDTRLSSPERPLRLMIGVKRAAVGDLESHAWVDDRRRILVGGPVGDEFLPMVAWDSVLP